MMPELAPQAELHRQIQQLPEVPMSDERIETVRSRILDVTVQPRTQTRRRVFVRSSVIAATVLAIAAAATLAWRTSTNRGLSVELATVADAAQTRPVAQAPVVAAPTIATPTTVTTRAPMPLVIARDGRARFVHKKTRSAAVAAVRIGDDIVRFYGDVEIVTTQGTLQEIRVRSGKAEVTKATSATNPYAVVVAGSIWRSPTRVQRSKLRLPTPPPRSEPGMQPRRILPTPATLPTPTTLPTPATLPAPTTLPIPATATKRPDVTKKVRDASAAKEAIAGARMQHTPAEHAFGRAWKQLRGQRYRDAAIGFARALTLRGATNIAEDARYWHAIALRRIGTSARAVTAMRTFLNRHGTSHRADRIRVMLGWLLLEAGKANAARPLFKRAARSTTDKVRKAATDGLKRLR